MNGPGQMTWFELDVFIYDLMIQILPYARNVDLYSKLVQRNHKETKLNSFKNLPLFVYKLLLYLLL